MSGINSIIINCTLINNTAKGYGGGFCWYGSNGTIIGSTFKGNTAVEGGAIFWNNGGVNGTIIDSTFTDNYATRYGGGVRWDGDYGTIIGSTFKGNTATRGGAVYWTIVGSMVNCSFINSKWINNNTRTNGIYAIKDLTINGGKGIVDIIANGTLTGISIVVLNNETYYYPPNTNINFIYSLENHKT